MAHVAAYLNIDIEGLELVHSVRPRVCVPRHFEPRILGEIHRVYAQIRKLSNGARQGGVSNLLEDDTPFAF